MNTTAAHHEASKKSPKFVKLLLSLHIGYLNDCIAIKAHRTFITTDDVRISFGWYCSWMDQITNNAFMDVI